MAILAILDVGHGNCAVLQDEKVFVFDAGRKNGLLEYLAENGIYEIEAVLLSHADADHIAGLLAVLAQPSISIQAVYLNPDPTKRSAVWEDLLFELERLPDITLHETLTSEDPGKLSSGTLQIEVLAPMPHLAAYGVGNVDGHGRKLDSNSLSAVIRVGKIDGISVLLPGDIDNIGLSNIVETGTEVHADILVFPHHGGHAKYGDMVRFAKQLGQLVGMKTVLFSMSRRSNNPLPDIVQGIRQFDPAVRFGCTQLSRHCAAALPSMPKKTLAFSRGNENNRCCAGTFLINFNINLLLPTIEDHQRFIKNNAPSALCLRQESTM